MPTNQQRRDTERLRLQRQLEARRQREQARKRATLIISIVGTVVLIAAVVAIAVVVSGGSSKTPAASGSSPAATSPAVSTLPTSSAPASSAPPPALAAPKPCTAPSKGSAASYRGVHVAGATDLQKAPKVTAQGKGTPKALECRDLVVGKGAKATPTSSVTVQYTGVLYKDGKVFDSSWSRGKAATFSLAQVVPGFTQGIGGTGKVAPMRVGGRRLMILPPSLGYGSQSAGPIPPNSTLVFIVDLLKVQG